MGQQTITTLTLSEGHNQPNSTQAIAVSGQLMTKSSVAKMLARKRDSIDRWHRLLLKNPAYRGARKAVAVFFEKAGKKPHKGCLPLHPFQVACLQEISNFQARGRNPRKNKSDGEIRAFIECHQTFWTRENWERGLFGSLAQFSAQTLKPSKA